MAWEHLPENYTDAVWSGLKRYMEIDNGDGTISFQDVTVYSNKERSFFGAKDANRMNQAMNIIMEMLEGGTDLYTTFLNYFEAQKVFFEDKANTTQTDFEDYVEGLKADGDRIINTIETDYRNEITAFESAQEQVFNTWFNLVKGQLSEDVAGNLQIQVDALTDRVALLEYMTLNNDFIAPIITDDGAVITDDLGNVIVANWKYKEE